LKRRLQRSFEVMRSPIFPGYYVYLAAIVLFIIPLMIENEFFRYFLILFCFNTILSLAWNILGSCGQFSFGNAALFGVGAYTSTLLFTRLDISPWLGMILGGGMAALASFFIGLITFRLRSVYFVMGTFAFAETLKHTFINLPELTGGSVGLFVPPGDSPINFQFTGKLPYYYYILSVMLFSTFISYHIFRSRIGYCLRAIADDEDAAESVGVYILKYKIIAFTVCAFLTGLAGAFYAEYMLYIEPFEIFGFNNSFKPVLSTLIGGLGTILGPIVGCLIVISIEELVRGILGELVGGTLGILNTLIIGILFIIVLLFQPEGIVSLLKHRPGYRKSLTVRAEGCKSRYNKKI